MFIYIFTALFIIGDIVTGVIKGCYFKNINSTLLRKGLYHKVSEIMSVAVAFLIEKSGEHINIGLSIPIIDVVCTYICLMELVSILENLAEINPPMMKIFKPYLAKLKEKEDDKNV